MSTGSTRRSLRRDTRGIATFEYAVLFVLIVVGTLVALYAFGPALAGLFSDDYSKSSGPVRSASTTGRGASISSSPSAQRRVAGSASTGDEAPSFGSRVWGAAKAAVGETVDLVAGGVVGVVPYASMTNPLPPFGNTKEFGQGMMVTSAGMMVAEVGAMAGDGALTIGSGGTAAAVTVPAAVGIATAAAGSVINWQNGAKLSQSAGISSGYGGGGSGAGGGGKKKPKLERYDGPKPKYEVNEAHVRGSPRYNPRKEPLPSDAEEVYKNAVPDRSSKAKNWFGKNSKGITYRYSGANGNAHFSGSSASKDGIRNMTDYAEDRLKGL